MKFYICICLIFVQLLGLFIGVDSVNAQEPVVHAVLFFSQTCPHCHKVISEDLAPLSEKYGEQLIILGIDTYTQQGNELYLAAVEYFNIPEERLGVPTLIVGEIILVGSLEIPEQFPAIIKEGIAGGGIDWPSIPGMDEIVSSAYAQATIQAEPVEQVTPTHPEPTPTKSENTPEFTETASLTSTIQPTIYTQPTPIKTESPQMENIFYESEYEKPKIAELFLRDPIGNTASVIVLIGMLVSVAMIGIRLARPSLAKIASPKWSIPLLSIIGLLVAGYLSFVEISQTEAVCGPVGDCNTVQQSSYARLFGLIPVGVLGLVGFSAIIITWAIQYHGPKKWQKLAARSIWGMTLSGTLFSIYLTYLEPFVIGATCAWCLTSAIVMTLLLWVSTTPFLQTWKFRFPLN